MGTKISDLTTGTALTDDDYLPFTDAGTLTTKKITFEDFKGSFITTDNWTPELSFGTPGDLAVSYTLQGGVYYKIGSLVWLQFRILTSSFTHSTASSLFRVTGLPFSMLTAAQMVGPLVMQGFTMATHTQFTVEGNIGNSYLEIYATGSGQDVSALSNAEVTSGSTISMIGSIMYMH